MVAEPGRQADAPWAEKHVIDWSKAQTRRFFKDSKLVKMEMAALDEGWDGQRLLNISRSVLDRHRVPNEERGSFVQKINTLLETSDRINLDAILAKKLSERKAYYETGEQILVYREKAETWVRANVIQHLPVGAECAPEGLMVCIYRESRGGEIRVEVQRYVHSRRKC